MALPICLEWKQTHKSTSSTLSCLVVYASLWHYTSWKLLLLATTFLILFFSSNQGTGMYVYIETSSPRQLGDTARLESPWMRGPQCMTLYYHMYGATMSCVVIYIKSQATNRLKPVWLRSQDQGNHWIHGQISINETSSYQVSFKFFVYSIWIRKIRKLNQATNMPCP